MILLVMVTNIICGIKNPDFDHVSIAKLATCLIVGVTVSIMNATIHISCI